MAIEDFEWEGEVELTEPPPVTGKPAASVAEQPWLSRLRGSVWLEPAAKLLGMAGLLGVLAGIGVVATTYAKPGMKLPDGPRALADALGTSWLKPALPDPQNDSHEGKRNVEGVPAHQHRAPALAQLPASPPRATVPAAPSAVPSATVAGPAAGILADGRVILNTASAEELTRLPGVGIKRAEAIVALRSKLKRFRSSTDLLRVKGIGPRGLKRMLPHLVLDAP